MTIDRDTAHAWVSYQDRFTGPERQKNMDHKRLVIFAAKVQALINGHHITNVGDKHDYIGGLIKDLERLDDAFSVPRSSIAITYGDCAGCGKPVGPPTNRTTPAAHCAGDKIYHGWCIPASPS
jgi:hypothetical protein